MKDAFLKADDLNVILIDWGGGSSFPYTQATANTRVVGAEIAKLIKVLQVRRKKNYNRNYITQTHVRIPNLVCRRVVYDNMCSILC